MDHQVTSAVLIVWPVASFQRTDSDWIVQSDGFFFSLSLSFSYSLSLCRAVTEAAWLTWPFVAPSLWPAVDKRDEERLTVKWGRGERKKRSFYLETVRGLNVELLSHLVKSRSSRSDWSSSEDLLLYLPVCLLSFIASSATLVAAFYIFLYLLLLYVFSRYTV